MKPNSIKWAILGTSFISEVMAKAIQESNISTLQAVGSRSLATGKNFADKFSISKYYTDYLALLNDPEIEVIYIGFPNHLHKEWIIRCAEAGKHILCEKPFALNAEEAQLAFAATQKANVFCMEALMYRCHPFIKQLRTLIQDKIIGDIRLFNAVYTANIADIANQAAGGAIRNLGCYPVSLIRLLANSEPTEIISLGRLNKKTQTDNQASTILKFENNIMATVSTADDIEMYWQFDVYGTKGHLKVISNPWLPDEENNKIIISRHNEKAPQEITVTAEKSLYTYQIDAVSQHIIDGKIQNYDDMSWQDSIGNAKVLDTWFQQVQIGA